MSYLVPDTAGRESCSDRRMADGGLRPIRPLNFPFVYFVHFVFIVAIEYWISVTFCRGL